MKEEAKDKCDPPVLPRQQQPPKRLNDGAANHAFQSMEDLYTRDYFEAIDKVDVVFFGGRRWFIVPRAGNSL